MRTDEGVKPKGQNGSETVFVVIQAGAGGDLMVVAVGTEEDG